ARDRLKTLQQQQDSDQQAAERRAHLLQELDAHAARSLDNLYAARLQQMCSAWDEVADNASDAEQQRANDAMQRCQARIDERDQHLAQQQEQQQARREQGIALDTLQQLVDEFRAEQWQELSSVRALVNTQKNRWQAAGEIGEADAALAKRADAMFALWQQALELVEPWQHCDDGEQRHALRQRWPGALPLPLVDTVRGASLTSSSYPGTLGGTSIRAQRTSDSTVVFQVPELAAGTHTLSMQIGRRSATAQLAVRATPPIEDPVAYIAEVDSLFLDEVEELEDWYAQADPTLG